MTDAIDRAHKLTYALVEFQYGADDDPQYFRITDKTSSVQLFGNDWESTPELTVKLPADAGTLADAQADLELKIRAGFLTNIASSDVHSKVNVVIMEVTDSETAGEEPTVLFLYRGFLSQSVRNPGGHSESVKLVLSRPLARLSYPMGIAAMLNCQNVLFGRGCFLDETDFEETGTLTAATGKSCTITGLADHSADPTARYWDRGYVELAGARIQIRDWSQATPTSFELRADIPASWVGETVRVVPGCDRLYATCDGRYGNKARFNGTGYAVPTYHPVFEDPK